MLTNMRIDAADITTGDIINGRTVALVLVRTHSFIVCFDDGTEGRIDADRTVLVRRPGTREVAYA